MKFVFIQKYFTNLKKSEFESCFDSPFIPIDNATHMKETIDNIKFASIELRLIENGEVILHPERRMAPPSLIQLNIYQRQNYAL